MAVARPSLRTRSSQLTAWSSGKILAQGAKSPGLTARSRPCAPQAVWYASQRPQLPPRISRLAPNARAYSGDGDAAPNLNIPLRGSSPRPIAHRTIALNTELRERLQPARAVRARARARARARSCGQVRDLALGTWNFGSDALSTELLPGLRCCCRVWLTCTPKASFASPRRDSARAPACPALRAFRMRSR